MSTQNYIIFYQLFLVIIAFFTIAKLLVNSYQSSNVPPPFSEHYKTLLLSFIIILLIAFFPIGEGGDKERYNELFLNIFEKNFNKDIGWVYYVKLCKTIIDEPLFFFLFTSIIYFIGNYYFFKSLVPKNYLFYFLLTTFGSMGYFAYGTNTIRAGLALSFLLIAYVHRKNIFWFIILAITAILIHKSMVILLSAIIITKLYTNTKVYLFIWLSCLILSIINISIVSQFLQTTFTDIDDRVVEYIGSGTNELYNSGFRYDFILYSIFPIIMGYYYIFKEEFKDKDYSKLYNTYLIVNSFWLLIIRIPFTDRFAYLSWFLYPFLMLYPLFYIYNIKNRYYKIAIIIIGLILFNTILILK